MYNNASQTAMDIIDRSSLSPEDRKLWKEQLEHSPAVLTGLFVELAQEDPSLLEAMTKNLHRKMAARSAQDFAAIFAEEKAILQTITD